MNKIPTSNALFSLILFLYCFLLLAVSFPFMLPRQRVHFCRCPRWLEEARCGALEDYVLHVSSWRPLAPWSIKLRLVNAGRSNLGDFAKNHSSEQRFVFLLSKFQSVSIRRLSLLCRRQDTSGQDWIRRGTKSEGKPLTVLSALIHQKLFTSPSLFDHM